MKELKKNQIFTVGIETYSSDGYGVCRVEGRAVFVPRAIVGEQWRIRIVKVTSSAVFARGEELLSPSACRVESSCPYFGKCGGCDLCHMRYDEELNFKLSRVNDALTHIGKQSVSASEILGSEKTERYRNKAIFAVAESEGSAAYGFFRERSHQLIPIDKCLLQDELSEKVAAAVVRFMNENAIPAYDEESGRGVVRHVFCRRALHTGDAVACIVAARGFGSATGRLVEALRQSCPELSGIVLNINKSRGNTVLAGDFYTLWGRADITDSLCGVRFNISPQSFFQINPPQAEKLYARAVEYASPARDSLVFDLYCGAGTISLCLAQRAGQVIGAEIVPEAIENAKKNAEMNGISNTEFLCADAGQAAAELAARGLKPDAVVVDPPRKGMSEEAVAAVAAMSPERVVYVSCNPATLARDILRFNSYGYTLEKVTAVDMFPRTCHVETVALLSRTKVGEIMEKYFEINKNNQNIRCKLYYDKRHSIEKVILYGHGFAGHKDNGAAQKFADKVLSKYKGVAVLLFNLPCHGDDVKKKMVLQDCMTYIEIVIDYIHSELNTNAVYSYASSFGGYLVLKYISEHENPFVKIALLCPAVNMADVLTCTIMKSDELEMLIKGKNVQVGFDRKIEINRQFLTDLEEADIQKIDYLDFADDILILHGTKDEVVPFGAVEKFAENNLIEFIPVENADHRFQNPDCMELATKKALEFFSF